MKREAPAVQESVCVDAREEACKILIVDLWGRYSVKVSGLEEFDEGAKTSPFAKLCGKALGKS